MMVPVVGFKIKLVPVTLVVSDVIVSMVLVGCIVVVSKVSLVNVCMFGVMLTMRSVVINTTEI